MSIEVTKVQHTCFVLETGAGRIAIDPALDFFGSLWSPRGNNELAGRLLAGVDAVVVTHAHSDHFHPPTLLRFDRATPIVIPAADREADHPMAKELREYGFTRVLELEDGASTELAGLRLTSVRAPDSIEGIPQQSLVFEYAGLRIVHGADTLEEFEALARIAAGGGVTLALLPLNCSINYRNLRNQMSPATFLAGTEILAPALVVPLGVGEGPKRGAKAVDAPWFPHQESLFRDEAFAGALPDGTRLAALRDGETLTLAPGPACSWPERLHDVADGGRARVETAQGRLWSLLIDIHVRDRHYFGLTRERGFAEWRDAWLECRVALTDALPDWDQVVGDTVARVPAERLKAPVLTMFPATIRRMSQGGASIADLVLDSLWLLESEQSELDYAQAVFRVLAAGVRNDAEALFHCRLEFSRLLQLEHEAKRAALPRGFTSELAARWAERQVAADLRAARYLYPRFNPVFGPFERPGREGGPLAFHALRRTEDRVKSVLLEVSDEQATLVAVLAEANGAISLADACTKADIPLTCYSELALRLAAFEPYALDCHWYPGQPFAWRPDYQL